MSTDGLVPYRGDYYLWKYVPSLPGAVIVLLLFLSATIAHIYKIWRTGTKFVIVFAVGGFFEFVGYCARASAHGKTGKMMPFAVQNMMILVAPALFAASIYMILSRIIISIRGEQYSVIRVTWMTKIFVFGDVFSFVVQGGAAGMMVAGGDIAQIGNDLVIGGLVFQTLMFGLFAVTALTFHRRMRNNVIAAAYDAGNKWEQSLQMLYAVSALIMIRSIFRVIEFVMGQDGYPLSNEWTLYVFDTIPMLIVMGLFYWRFPSDYQNKAGWDEMHTPLGEMDKDGYISR